MYSLWKRTYDGWKMTLRDNRTLVGMWVEEPERYALVFLTLGGLSLRGKIASDGGLHFWTPFCLPLHEVFFHVVSLDLITKEVESTIPPIVHFEWNTSLYPLLGYNSTWMKQCKQRSFHRLRPLIFPIHCYDELFLEPGRTNEDVKADIQRLVPDASDSVNNVIVLTEGMFLILYATASMTSVTGCSKDCLERILEWV